MCVHVFLRDDDAETGLVLDDAGLSVVRTASRQTGSQAGIRVGRETDRLRETRDMRVSVMTHVVVVSSVMLVFHGLNYPQAPRIRPPKSAAGCELQAFKGLSLCHRIKRSPRTFSWLTDGAVQSGLWPLTSVSDLVDEMAARI